MDQLIADRAAKFMENYTDVWYPEERKGARYLKRRPALDFMEAQTLVNTWDDARLEMLARIFLSSTHPFAKGGTRSIGQFAALASWCDGQLCELEAKR